MPGSRDASTRPMTPPASPRVRAPASIRLFAVLMALSLALKLIVAGWLSAAGLSLLFWMWFDVVAVSALFAALTYRIVARADRRMVMPLFFLSVAVIVLEATVWNTVTSAFVDLFGFRISLSAPVLMLAALFALSTTSSRAWFDRAR